MTAALRLEMPDLAVDIFEDSFGFCFDTDPAKGENRVKTYMITVFVRCWQFDYFFIFVSSKLYSTFLCLLSSPLYSPSYVFHFILFDLCTPRTTFSI